jgi:hypothetical protein
MKRSCPPKSRVHAHAVLALAAAGAVLASGCSGGSAKATHQTRLDRAIHKLESGETVSKISKDAASGVDVESAVLESGGDGASAPAAPVVVAADPCPSVQTPGPTAIESAWLGALQSLGACLRQAMMPYNLANGALAYTKAYSRSVSEKPLSRMNDVELAEFLQKEMIPPAVLTGVGADKAPMKSKLRSRFEDRELDELVRLAHRVQDRLVKAEAVFDAAVDAHRAVVEHYARLSDRYRVLLALRDTSGDTTGNETASKIAEILGKSGLGVPRDFKSFPVSALHPWTLVAVTPDEGHEADRLNDPLENPFKVVIHAFADLGGPLEMVSRQRKHYAELRDHDNPTMPSHPAPAEGAVRVAVVDTGIDFVKYPELGEFLSSGQGGAMASVDYADGDLNPYLPSQGIDSHGSGTSASILTVLSHAAPEVLRARKLDLAMLKANTIRDQLASPFMGVSSWQNRMAIEEALITQATDPSVTVKPQIVSISAIFALQKFLKNAGREDAVLNAPWLWVMAAGNAGVPVESSPAPACLNDVPREKRVDARIVCVGALKRGILQDKIAGYSDFGDRVDVYAYESYINLCPNGTSCSTPAISGAAAAVAARYPELSPERIKEVLVESAEERTLDVDSQGTPAASLAGSGSGGALASLLEFWSNGDVPVGAPVGPALTRTVRVLDPLTMMSRVMEVAARKAGR